MIQMVMYAIISLVALFGVGAMMLLVSAGFTARCEEEHWAAYWLDTPSTERSLRVCVLKSEDFGECVDKAA